MDREKFHNKYVRFFLLSMRSQAIHWKSLLSLILIFITIFFVLCYLFEATSSASSPFQKGDLIWYAMLNEALIIASQGSHRSVQNDLKHGLISASLTKPLSYLKMKIADELGSSIVNLSVIGTLACVLTTLWTHYFPFSFAETCLVVVLALVAMTLLLLFNIALGLLSFWIDDVEPLYWLWMKSIFIFGGLFLPLATYPLFLQKVAHLSPFPTILAARSAAGLFEPFSIHIFVTSAFWIGCSLLLLRLLFRKGLRYENSCGGNL
jgi:ABC-2 type transport system permease protein